MRWARRWWAVGVAAVLLVAGAAWWLARTREVIPAPDTEPAVPPERPPATAPPYIPDALPAGRRLEEIAVALGGTEGMYVLAWGICGHDPKGQSDHCLVMQVPSADHGAGRWCLSKLYRHRYAADPRWHVAMTHVSGRDPKSGFYRGRWIWYSVGFEKRPTNDGMMAAIRDHEEGVGWSFFPKHQRELVRSEVCERNWARVIGEKAPPDVNDW